MTTTVTEQAYLDSFRSWLPGGANGGPGGYVEGPNNDTPFGIRFGLNHRAWCLMFAMCCAEDAGLPFEIRTAGTRYAAAKFHELGLLRADPAPGALGLLFAGHAPGTGHAVTCEYVRADGVAATIEGNTDVRGGRTGGRVMRQLRSPASLGAGGGWVHRKFAPAGTASASPEEDDDVNRVYSFDDHYWATDMISTRQITGSIDFDYFINPGAKPRAEDLGPVNPAFHKSLVDVTPKP